MPDLFELIVKWWKQIAGIVLLSLAIVAVIVFNKPNQYLSVATAVPLSPFSNDKAWVFNRNIEALYSALGSPDELDRILGTANLDTVFISVTDQYQLQEYYAIKETGAAARNKAASILKKNTRVVKSEYGELKVRVWDVAKEKAALFANAIMDKLQSMHQDLQGTGNETALKGLGLALQKLRVETPAAQQQEQSYKERVNEYEKLIAEYQWMVDNKPAALAVTEKAKPADWPDRPRRVQLLVATAILAFLFSIAVALLLEKRKNS